VSVLIDGYNLLHITGIFGRGRALSSLERARTALLNMLAMSIAPDEVGQTTIVFDANDAPLGLPRKVDHRGLTVCYAAEYVDADTMIEELIARHHAPRQLLVVSSDHRIQRAARRRRANPIDSDVWYAELVRQREARGQIPVREAAKPTVPLSESEVEFWLTQFAEEPTSDSAADRTEDAENESETTFDNPFPPSYGEDLLEE